MTWRNDYNLTYMKARHYVIFKKKKRNPFISLKIHKWPILHNFLKKLLIHDSTLTCSYRVYSEAEYPPHTDG